MIRGLLAIGAALVAGCQAPPSDPFVRAEHALATGDLLMALADFDGVPVAHPRYPQARAAAAGVERLMRKSHEHLFDGLLLRREWRDAEAIAAFQRARDVWPKLPTVPELIVATEQRQRLFPDGPAATPMAEVAPEQTATTQPLWEGDEGAAVMAGRDAAPVAGTDVARPAIAMGGQGGDAVGARLAAIEESLASGRMDVAVGELMLLHQQHSQDLRVQKRLARVLVQRGLVRYGRGDTGGARQDWQRAAELDPECAAPALLKAVGS